nr:cysteine-rich receptor-like protein kinase 25 [Ipomoea batatas]
MSLITKGDSDPTYYCPNTTSYTPNSTYKANLDSLLSNLYSNATRHNTNGFYSTTVGSNDTVYGLFLCRGDVAPDVCGGCIGVAREKILELCSYGKTAMIWYGKCMLRYSETSMLGILDQTTSFTKRNRNDTQPNEYMQLVGSVLDRVTTQAASSGSAKKFAVLEANFSAFERVYALGQCTPDLSVSDCRICFRNVIAMLPRCCYGAIGAQAVYPSCNIRYELFPFYNHSAEAAPPAPPPNNPPPPSTTLHNSSSTKVSNPGSIPPRPAPVPPRASRGNKGKVIIAASVASVTGVLLFILSFCFLKKRRAKKDLSHVKETTTDMTEISIEESVQFEFSTIEAITNCFSINNKIGEGGYGAVYKGRLPNGQEVAVKRLSKSSTQGVEEFKNEVALVAKLQHRSLVRAWKHWREDRALEVVDQSLGGLYSRNEVIQCIRVGLLCVQEEVEDRPTMANVMLMLNSHSSSWRSPNPPAYFNGGSQMILAAQEGDLSTSKSLPLSVNEVSISELDPR